MDDQELRHQLDLKYGTGRVPHYAEDESLPVFFYGGPFSNFVGGPFLITARQPWGISDVVNLYGTVEHFYQASKAATPDDHYWVCKPWNPGEAKVRGQHVDLREDWEVGDPPTKYNVMVEGLRFKFAEGKWRDELLATGKRYIAEDSPTDAIWGIRDSQNGFAGLNLLGLALMQIRDEITGNAGT